MLVGAVAVRSRAARDSEHERRDPARSGRRTANEIAYFVNQGEQRGLWRVNISGAQPEFLAAGTESRGGSWNRDDTLLLALDPHQRPADDDGAARTRRCRFVTQRRRRRPKESQHMWPQFLPDGQRFIFFVLSSDDNVEGVYLGSLDGGRPKLLVKTPHQRPARRRLADLHDERPPVHADAGHGSRPR